MDDRLEKLVRQRARHACEYCKMPDEVRPLRFEIEHVVSKQHGGETISANLAYACLHCNRHKGPNLAGIDRRGAVARMTPLFNPRRQKWESHFRWDGPFVVGKTAIGRVTIMVLAMNEPMRMMLRTELMAEGLFPLKQ
jgi:hypothetical protein